MSNPAAVTLPIESTTTPPSVEGAVAGGGTPAAPAVPVAEELESYKKQLADTKAALTKAQQQLAEAAKPKDPAPAEAPEAPKKDDAAAPKEPEKAAEEAAVALDVDLDALRTEFSNTGNLTDDSRAKALPLAEAVFSHIKDEAARKEAAKGLLEEYLAGQRLMMDREQAEYDSLIGGRQEYENMLSWASTNLSEAEAAAFNRQRTSGDKHAAAMAVQGLYARYTKAGAKKPTLFAGATVPGAVSEGVYKTYAEMTADMRNPLYSKSAEFRAQVVAKLARSDVQK